MEYLLPVQWNRVLCNEDILAKLQVQLYDATLTNILLWGCESWVLTEELRTKNEAWSLSQHISKENGRYHNNKTSELV